MPATDDYAHVIKKTAAMVRDQKVQQLAKAYGLQVLDFTWEDAARFDSSAVGPNISGTTIQVQHQVPGRDDYQLNCMGRRNRDFAKPLLPLGGNAGRTDLSVSETTNRWSASKKPVKWRLCISPLD